jgi:pyruvate-formate lyase-activating enzyme
MTESQLPVPYGFLTEEAASFPSCVQLTLCHYLCNCACLSCPVGRLNRGDAEAVARWQADGGQRLFMPWEVFEKAAQETSQHPNSFMRFHARGEPTLHPRFVDMIAYAKAIGVSTVQVFTNGLELDQRLARRVLDSGLDVIEFSIHGHTQTYATLMGNEHFEQVVENVMYLVRLRNELGKRTKVVVSAVDQPGFQPEKEIHRRFWSERVDQVILRPYHSWGGRIPCEVQEPARRHPCPQLWTRLTVGPTGKILFCFNSWDEAEREVVANLLEPDVTLAGVWQSERYAYTRAAHLAGDYTLHCCSQCRDWIGSAWGNNSYEALIRKLNA